MPQNCLLGLEEYVCTFQCLTHCPIPDGDCIWSDPDIGCYDLVEYPEFFWWRLGHLTEEQKRVLIELGSDMMIITPDSMDEFYKEPEPVGDIHRCRRCLSTNIHIRKVWIVCNNCGYGEPLIDFPENVGRI